MSTLTNTIPLSNDTPNNVIPVAGLSDTLKNFSISMAQGKAIPVGNQGTYNQPQPRASFSIDTSSPIPSTALSSNVTPNDVLRQRSSYADQLSQLDGIKSRLLELQQQVGSLNSNSLNPFTDPERYLNNKLYGTPQLGQAGQNITDINRTIGDTTTNFYNNREQQITDNYDQFGVGDRQTELSNTRTRIAERQKKLREDLKSFESDPRYTGMARPFSEDHKQRLQNDADFELANLSIIEAAQTGNLQEARQLAQDLTDRQFQSFQGTIDAYQSQIEAEMPMYNAEQKQQAMQLQVALDQYKQQGEVARQDIVARRNLVIEVAGEGAPQDVLDAMLQAPTMEEAIRAAGNWIGYMDRMNQWSIMNDRNKVAGGDAADAEIQTGDDAVQQMNFLRTQVTDALKLVKASGPSGITKVVGDFFVGDTDYRRLEAITNTLRSNMLTLATDPNIKKFFGPQMSNADVKLMTAAATTLNPENQSPEDMKKELERLLEVFERLSNVTPLEVGSTGTLSSGITYTIK